MENNFSIQTDNKIVDQMSKINFSRNVFPEIWYQTIVNENGKVNFLAINILADVVYWYRPTEIRDEKTGMLLNKQKNYSLNTISLTGWLIGAIRGGYKPKYRPD